jgi:hypothetical protein
LAYVFAGCCIIVQGVVKALFEHRMLPRVLAGSSVGSIVAGLVATRTDDELRETFRCACCSLFFPPHSLSLLSNLGVCQKAGLPCYGPVSAVCTGSSMPSKTVPARRVQLCLSFHALRLFSQSSLFSSFYCCARPVALLLLTHLHMCARFRRKLDNIELSFFNNSRAVELVHSFLQKGALHDMSFLQVCLSHCGSQGIP